jgi:peptide/nickel transport system permease protein
MRITDTMLTFPTILIALLIDGVTRAALPRDVHDQVALYVVIFAIGISNWPSFARTCAARRWWSATRNTCRPRA